MWEVNDQNAIIYPSQSFGLAGTCSGRYPVNTGILPKIHYFLKYHILKIIFKYDLFWRINSKFLKIYTFIFGFLLQKYF